MFERNGKHKMKKFIALFLVFATAAVILCGCGNFNVKSINPYDYVTVGDYKNFSIDDFKKAYEEEREAMASEMTSFNVDWGYTVVFNIVCEIIGGDDKTATYTKYEKYCHEGDDTMTINIYENTEDAYRSTFDSAFVYDVTEADGMSTSANLRTIKIGTAFDFTLTEPYSPENPEISGKKVRFTVTPVKVLPPVYDDNDILESLNSFYDKYPAEPNSASIGDIVSADIEGTIGGELRDGLKYDGRTFVLGCSEYPASFDEQLVGLIKGGRREFSVTFPADWPNADLAGETVDFSVKITEITSYNKPIKDNTKYASLYELKEALRLELFVEFEIMNVVYDRSELKSVPKGLYDEYLKHIKASTEDNIKEYMKSFTQSGTTVSRDDVIKTIWGSEEEYEKYIEYNATQTTMQTLVCYAVVDELGIEYTDAMYKEDLAEFVSAYNLNYQSDYSASKVESICNKNVLKLIFLEQKACEVLASKIDGFPVLDFE